jgi:hypothetical protein
MAPAARYALAFAHLSLLWSWIIARDKKKYSIL